jgi:hypothetical protein
VGLTVDHQRARSADAFATIVVERHGLTTFRNQSFVEHVEQLQERRLVADRVDPVALEVSLDIRARLPPDPQREIRQVSTQDVAPK